MFSYDADEQLSDDEVVFFGTTTLQEIKRRIFQDKQQKTLCAASIANSPNNTEDLNKSLKILQAHSQPNLISGRDNLNLDFYDLNSSECDMKAADDSFIKMENIVAKLCVSPKNNEKTEELNNTLEVIEYILNNPPGSTTKDREEKMDDIRLKTEHPVLKNTPQKIYSGQKNNYACNSPQPPQNTPVKTTTQPLTHIEGHTTPTDIKNKTILKTSAQLSSVKKPSARDEKVDDIRLKTENAVVKKEKDVSDLSPEKMYSGHKNNEAYNSPKPPRNTVKTTIQPVMHIEGHTTPPTGLKHNSFLKTSDQLSSLKKPSARDERVDDIRLKTENAVGKKKKDGSDLSPEKMYSGRKKKDAYNSLESPKNTPVKTTNQPHKNIEGHTTPRDIKHKPIFKTPAQPPSLNKPSSSSLKKTPSRSNAYQHIGSPVASYIKNCPVAPLVKDVNPKKPWPGSSSIPKLVKNTPLAKPSNKENVNLPSLAYKSAKKTKVIEMPDEQKMPQSQWAKKTLPRPTVMTHDHRELNFAKKKLMPQQEDSFADLSYTQAEVSVCTKKSAFKTNKNI